MIQSVKCLPREILNSDSQNPHKNWPDTTSPAVSALGRQRSTDPGIHWPTSITKQRAPGSVRIRAKEEDAWGQTLVSVCTCTPPQTCTHSWELVHMNTAPPNRGRERSKGVGSALYLEVNGAGFSPSPFMWLLGLKLRLPGLCGKRLLPTEPPCRPFFFLERVSLGGSGQPLTQGTPALALQSWDFRRVTKSNRSFIILRWSSSVMWRGL